MPESPIYSRKMANLQRPALNYRMRAPIVMATLTCVALAGPGGAADKQWQVGTWADISVKRQIFDFGPGSSTFGPPRAAPTMRALADVRVYVIETDDLRIELRDVVQIGHRSIDATIGEAVTFALDKKSVYVRDADGIEHRLRVTKKTPRPRS